MAPTIPDALPQIGALGALTGDRHNPTGWLEAVSDAAYDVLSFYEESAYRVEGLRLYLDRQTWEDAFSALDQEGVAVFSPGLGVITER